MEIKIKKKYCSPTSETVELTMKGILCQSQLGLDENYGNRKLEDRQDGGYWGGDQDVWY